MLCIYYRKIYKQILWIYPGGGGGGTRLSCERGGGGVPLGVENLTLSQCARCTKNTLCRNALGAQKIHTVTIYLTKKFASAYPVAILHRRWCPDRGPVVNIVGWEPLGSNPVINGVARQ